MGARLSAKDAIVFAPEFTQHKTAIENSPIVAFVHATAEARPGTPPCSPGRGNPLHQPTPTRNPDAPPSTPSPPSRRATLSLRTTAWCPHPCYHPPLACQSLREPQTRGAATSAAPPGCARATAWCGCGCHGGCGCRPVQCGAAPFQTPGRTGPAGGMARVRCGEITARGSGLQVTRQMMSIFQLPHSHHEHCCNHQPRFFSLALKVCSLAVS